MELHEYLLTKCVQVNFVPVNVSLYPSGRYQHELALSYRVCLEQAQHSGRPLPYGGVREEGIITLSTGEKFEDLDFRIKIYAETNELKNNFVEQCRELRQRQGQKPWARMSIEGLEGFDKEDIGLISYLPDDLDSRFARCFVFVLVPKVTFDGLFSAARLGHLPGEISINVECMRGEKWDNKTFADLPVTSIAFGEIPLAAAAHTVENGKLIEVGFDDEFSPTRSQVDELLTKLDVVAIGIKNVLLAVLGIGALILILRIFK